MAEPQFQMPDMKNVMASMSNSKGKIVMVLLFILLFFVLMYIYLMIQKRKYNCKLLQSYPYKPMLALPESVLATPLRRTFIKTAYNCCCTGDFKNDYVDTCALLNCAKQGVRALDFTIYSVHGDPVIAASTLVSKKYKEMYNYLPFSKTMSQVKQMFLQDTANCSNVTDPLFLIFRIQSANIPIYNKIGDILQSIFGYGNSSGSKFFKTTTNNILDNEPISRLKGKVIVIVDVTGLVGYENSTLAPITALTFGTLDNQIYRESDAFDLLDSGIAPNALHVNALYPDFNAKSINYDFNTVGIKQKFQFIAMNFQQNDVYLQNYNDFFKSSIVKQPET